jgi:hypothetical protein
MEAFFSVVFYTNTLAHQQENFRGNSALARIAYAVLRLID